MNPILIAALVGVLAVGAQSAGTLAGRGIIKGIKAIHHHVVTPAAKGAKALALHQVKK